MIRSESCSVSLPHDDLELQSDENVEDDGEDGEGEGIGWKVC